MRLHNLYSVMLRHVRNYKKVMYKVFIFAEEIFRASTLEDALAFALSLHRSSNVKHTIDVYGVDDDKDFITLVKE